MVWLTAWASSCFFHGGEGQRCIFRPLLLHRPRFIFLDLIFYRYHSYTASLRFTSFPLRQFQHTVWTDVTCIITPASPSLLVSSPSRFFTHFVQSRFVRVDFLFLFFFFIYSDQMRRKARRCSAVSLSLGFLPTVYLYTCRGRMID